MRSVLCVPCNASEIFFHVSQMLFSRTVMRRIEIEQHYVVEHSAEQ